MADLAVGLAIALDVLSSVDEVKICTGYEVGRDVHTEFPGDITALERVTPRYEWMEGWKRPTSAARRCRGPFPRRLRIGPAGVAR